MLPSDTTMKMMKCPLNGLRNINEFTFGGEVDIKASRFLDDDKAWAESLFYKYNGLDWVLEWWQHRASGYWFVAERHRLSNEIKQTFDAKEIFDQKIDYQSIVDTKNNAGSESK